MAVSTVMGAAHRAKIASLAADAHAPVVEAGRSADVGAGVILIGPADDLPRIESIRAQLAPLGVVCIHGASDRRFDELKSQLTPLGHMGVCPDAPGFDLWWGSASGWAGREKVGALPTIVSYFTTGTPYEDEAKKLAASCESLGLRIVARGLRPRDSWESNCAMKAGFLLDVWSELRGPILWVDADALVRRTPTLLAGISADIGVHKVDRWQFASGTIYFGATELAGELLRVWKRRCEADPTVWDQVHLDRAWSEVAAAHPLDTAWLPQAYTRIFDRPQDDDGGGSAVVEHFQASRRHKGAVSGGVVRKGIDFTLEMKAARRASRLESPASSATTSPTTTPGPMRSKNVMDADASDQRRFSQAARVASTCAELGLRSIALYGAGRYTQPITRQPWAWHGVAVRAIIDDAPTAGSIRGVPVVTPDRVPSGIEAVVVSSDRFGDQIEKRARQVFGARGLPILRIDQPEIVWEPSDASFARLIARGLDPADARWLVENRTERHDATLPMLPPSRTELHLRRYELAASLAADGGRALDAASGTGYGSALLHELKGLDVTGVDIDPKAVDYATRRHGADRVRFKVASADNTGLADASIDLIASFETIEHVPDPEKALHEFARVLQPGGKLVISTPNDWGLTDFHVHSFTPDEFRSVVARVFPTVHWFGQRCGDSPVSAPLPPGIFPIEDTRWELGTLIAVATRS